MFICVYNSMLLNFSSIHYNRVYSVYKDGGRRMLEHYAFRP